MKYIAALLFLTAAAALQRCPDDSWSAFQGSCYAVSPTSGPWTSAAALCDLMHPSALPASVHNREVNAHLETLLRGSPAWLGLSRAAGGDFAWLDNTTVDFQYWDVEEPDSGSNCTVINSNNVTGQWAAMDCGVVTATVCQTEPAPACPDDWTPYQDKCIWFSGNVTVSGYSVASACYSLDPPAQPASIHSEDETAVLTQLILESGTTKPFPWTGLTLEAENGNWTWLDGSAVDFLNWEDGRPRGHECGGMDARSRWSGRWWDEPCYLADRPYLCQLKL